MSIRTRKVFVSDTTTYNPNVMDNWLAGSEYYKSTYAGNINFSPTSFANGKIFEQNNKSYTLDTSYLKGSLNLFLNPPFADIINFMIVGNFINLFDFTTQKYVKVFVYVKNVNGNIFYAGIDATDFSGDGNDLNDSLDGLAKSLGYGTDAPSQGEWSTELSKIGGMFGFGGYMAGGIIGGLMDDNPSASIGGFAINTAEDMVSSQITSGLVNAFGITNMAQVTVMGMVVSSVVSETFEVAVGLDAHFGFGGDITGLRDGISDLNNHYSAPETFHDFIANSFVGSFLNMEDDYLNNFTTDIYGNINGYTDGDGMFHDTSNTYDGIDVTNPNVQTTVNTSLTDSYFSSYDGENNDSDHGDGADGGDGSAGGGSGQNDGSGHSDGGGGSSW